MVKTKKVAFLFVCTVLVDFVIPCLCVTIENYHYVYLTMLRLNKCYVMFLFYFSKGFLLKTSECTSIQNYTLKRNLKKTIGEYKLI